MPRRFRTTFGKKTVVPFKTEDINNMMVECKKKRQQAEEENCSHEIYMWDRNYMMQVVGINTAFRIEDILQLKVDNFKNGIIYLREFKTGKEQQFELHPSLWKDIQDYIKRNKLVSGEYLFKSRKGNNKPITRQRAWQVIKELADNARVNYTVGPHSLRKYFARQFYEKTGDIITLQKMLNHSSPQVTLIYICWGDDDVYTARKNFYLGN